MKLFFKIIKEKVLVNKRISRIFSVVILLLPDRLKVGEEECVISAL